LVATPHRGEIWWGETARAGRRPYLILSRDEVIPVVNAVVTAPITRTIRGIRSELALSETDGMPQECVASFDNIRVLKKTNLISRITALGPVRMREACDALCAAVDC
jgi:mRNA interferase MazF